MPHQTSPTGRILVGTDGSPASVAAVRWAAREAQLRGLRVHVVYVRDRRLPTPYYAPQPRAAEAAYGAAAGESTLKAVVQEALGSQPVPNQNDADQRDGAQTGAVPMDVVPMDTVQMELAEGAPARVLLERSVGAEMLVLGSTRPNPGPAGRAGTASAAAARPGRSVPWPGTACTRRPARSWSSVPARRGQRPSPCTLSPGSGGTAHDSQAGQSRPGLSGAGPVPRRRDRAPFGVPGSHPVAIQRPAGQPPGPEHRERRGEHGHGDHEKYATGQLTLAQRGRLRAVVGESDVLRPPANREP